MRKSRVNHINFAQSSAIELLKIPPEDAREKSTYIGSLIKRKIAVTIKNERIGDVAPVIIHGFWQIQFEYDAGFRVVLYTCSLRKSLV